MDFLSEIIDEFDEFDEQAKAATLPGINCRAVTRRQKNASSEHSSKDRFRVSSFIPMLDAALEANLRAIV